jgi:hypothetical protein
LGADGITRADGAATPDVTVRGTASSLMLAAINRVEWSSMEIEGNGALLDEWSKALRF